MNFIHLRNRIIKRKSKSLPNLSTLFSIVADIEKENSESESELNSISRSNSLGNDSIILVDESLLVDDNNFENKEKDNFDIKPKNLKFDTNTIMPFDNKIALKMIPSMKDKDDLHRFCRCVDIIWKPLTEKKDKQLCLDIIISKLEKSAYEVVRYKNFDNWPGLKKALETKFVRRRSQGIVSTELISVIQINDVSSFASKVELLLGELNEICIANQDGENVDIIMELNENTALSSFVNGLVEPLSTIVKAQNFKSLSEAIEHALDEEVSQKSKFNKQNLKLKCTFCNKSNHKSDNCFKNPSNLQNRNKNTNSNNFNKNVSHSSNFQNNFQSTTSNNKNSNSTSNQTANQSNIFCNYCKATDHIISNCFKKKYNELKRTINPPESIVQTPNPGCHQVQATSNSQETHSENFQRTQQTPSTLVRVRDLSAQNNQI